MELDEVGQVLAKCSAYDLRTVGRADIAAWAEVIGEVELVDALDAVTRHYRESSNRAMSADIFRHAKAAKGDRLRRDRVRSEALALPGRTEPDDARGARIRRGYAECVAAIPKPRKPQRDEAEATAMKVLRSMTDGPQWPDPEAT